MAQVPVTENFRVLPDTGIGARFDGNVKPAYISGNAKNIMNGLDGLVQFAQRREEDHLKDVANQIADYRAKQKQDYFLKENKLAVENEFGENVLQNLYDDDKENIDSIFSENGLSGAQQHKVRDILAANTRDFMISTKDHYNKQYDSQRTLVHNQLLTEDAKTLVDVGFGDGVNKDKANELVAKMYRDNVEFYSAKMPVEQAQIEAQNAMSGMLAGLIKAELNNGNSDRADAMMQDWGNLISWQFKLELKSSLAQVANSEYGDQLGNIAGSGGVFHMGGEAGSDGSHFISKGNVNIKGLPSGMIQAAQVASKDLGIPVEYLVNQFITETSNGKGGWSPRAQHFNFGAMKPSKGEKSYASVTKEERNGKMVSEATRWSSYNSPEEFGHAYASRIRRLWPKALNARNPFEYYNALQQSSKVKYATKSTYAQEMASSFKQRFGVGSGMSANGSAGTTIKVPKFDDPNKFEQWLSQSGLPKSIQQAALQRFSKNWHGEQEQKNLIVRQQIEHNQLVESKLRLTDAQSSARGYLSSLTPGEQKIFETNKNADPNARYKNAMFYLNDDNWMRYHSTPKEQKQILIATGGDRNLMAYAAQRLKELNDPFARDLSYHTFKDANVQLIKGLGYKSYNSMMNDSDGQEKYLSAKQQVDSQISNFWEKNKKPPSRKEVSGWVADAVSNANNSSGFFDWLGF